MSEYIEFPLADGGVVIIEVAEAAVAQPGQMGGLEDASLGDKTTKVLARADQTFDAAVDNVRDAASVLLRKLKSVADTPDEIEVTFGLKASGELGGNFVVAKAGLEANYSVKLTWKNEKKVVTGGQ